MFVRLSVPNGAAKPIVPSGWGNEFRPGLRELSGRKRAPRRSRPSTQLVGLVAPRQPTFDLLAIAPEWTQTDSNGFLSGLNRFATGSCATFNPALTFAGNDSR